MDYELKHYMTLFEFREEDLLEPEEEEHIVEPGVNQNQVLENLLDQLMDQVSVTDNEDYDNGYNDALNYMIGILDNKLRGQE